MLLGGSAIGKRAGAFQYDIHAQIPPGQILYLRLAQQGDGIAVHQQAAFVTLQGPGKTPVSRIITGQVQHGAGVRQFVDRHYL